MIGDEAMKTMRYRIRVISFVLVCALLTSLFIVFRALWLPQDVSGLPASSDSPSSAFPSQTETTDPEIPSSAEISSPVQELPSPEETPSDNPLYDIFGL